MALIGLFALLFWLTAATPAHAIPVALVAGILAISAEGFLAAAITFAINFAISAAISFVAGALLKPAPKAATSPTMAETSPAGTKVSQGDSSGEHPILFGRTRIGLVRELIACTHNNEFLYANYFATGHKCQAWHEVWLNDEKFSVADIVANGGFIPDSTGSKYAGMVRFKFYLGDPNQAADPDLIAEVPEWTPDHRCAGLAYVSVRFLFGPTGPKPPLFQEGLPNLTGILDGVCEAYDPRTGTTGWTENPALLLAWYLCNPVYGLGLDYNTAIRGPAPDYPGEAALIAAANVNDESVAKADGTTEKRYTANGVLMSSLVPQDIIGKLLGAMHGKRAFDGETWMIYAGVYHTPTITLTDDDLRAGMKVTTIKPKDELFNAVRGEYFAPENNWQLTDFPVYKSAAYAAIDGRVSYDDIDLPLTNSPSMAQRIAKIHLEQARRQISISAPCKFTAWRVAAGGTEMWTSARRAWTNKPFEIRRCVFKIEDSGGGPALCVDLDGAETAPGVYDWSSTEEQIVAQAPPTSLPSVTNVLPVTNLSISDELYETADGVGVRSKMVATWEPSPDGFVTGYQYEWKPHADSVYQTFTTPGTTFTVYDLADGDYDVRIAAVNYVGNLSPYVAATHTVAGLSSPPASITGFGGQWIGGAVHLYWDKSTDLDVIHGGAVEIRHSSATSGATWATATPIGNVEIPGAATSAFLPGKAGTYLARFRDARESGGNLSSGTAAWVTDQQVALAAFNILDGLVEDPTFTGTKTQCEVHSSKLRIIPGKSVAVYEWSDTIDLGSVKRARCTVEISAAVVNNADLVSAWPSIAERHRITSAVSGKEAWAITYVSTTNDNPAGTPTWSNYRRIDAAEFNCRAYRYKTELHAIDTTFGIEIESLLALVEELA